MRDASATLGDLHRRNLRLRADAPALVFEDRRFSHRELIGEACRLANSLMRLGVRRGDRVAILAENCPEYMQAYAAGELAGWTTVTINYRLAAPEIAYILDDSRPRFIIVDATYVDRLGANRIDGVQNVLTFGGSGPDLSYEEVLGTEEPTLPDADVRPEDIAHLIYTSGTTGRPKGVMLSHRAQLQSAMISAIEQCVVPTDRLALAMPFYHIGAKNSVALPFAAWLSNCSASRLSPAGVLSLAARTCGDSDLAGADHAQRPARRRELQPDDTSRFAEDLLFGGADARGAAAPWPRCAGTPLFTDVRHDRVRAGPVACCMLISMRWMGRRTSLAACVPPVSPWWVAMCA